MTTYNVLVGVIKHVQADNPSEALDKLTAELTAAGFRPYLLGNIAPPAVFESLDQSRDEDSVSQPE